MSNTALEVIDHHPASAALKKLEGLLETIDDRLEVLAEGRDYTTQTAVAQDHDERMQHARAAAAEVLEQPQPPEIHFRHLAGRTLPPPHRD